MMENKLRIAYRIFAVNSLRDNEEFNFYWPEEPREINIADFEYVSKYKFKYCVDMVNGLALYLIKKEE